MMRAFFLISDVPLPIEFFIASDPSAIVEHTKRVLYLEDDDIAHISEGGYNFLLYRSSYSQITSRRWYFFINQNYSNIGTRNC